MTQPLANASEVARPIDGTDTNAWGTPLSNCVDLFDRFSGGRATIDVTAADITLSTLEGQNHHINVTGSPTVDRNVVFPVRHRRYFVRNSSTRTLALHVSGFAANKLYLGAGLGMLVIVSTAGDAWSTAPATHQSGSFPDTIQHPLAATGGASLYLGPGLFFEGRLVGLARRGAGVMGVGLVAGGDSIRFHAASSAVSPLIGFANAGFSAYNTGFYRNGDAVSWTRLGVFQGLLGQGLTVGSPTGGEKGLGTINTQGVIHRNGTALAFQTQFAQNSLTVASGSGATFSHALAGVPDVLGRLRAAVANNGYLVGDTIPAPPACGLGANTTQVWYRIATAGIPILNKSTGAAAALSSSQWVLDLVAHF